MNRSRCMSVYEKNKILNIACIFWYLHLEYIYIRFLLGTTLQCNIDRYWQILRVRDLNFHCSTLCVTQSKLSTVISAPAKHSSRDREGEALLSTCSDLDHWDRWQRSDMLGWIHVLLVCAQTQLPPGVLAPSIQLTICEENQHNTFLSY